MPNFSDPAFQIRFIGLLIGLIIGTTFHEFGHAFTALMLGDDTAKRMGRVTLNPVAHFDPLGFVLMIMLAAGLFGFAWGKPTPVNPARLNGGRKGNSLVALGGPFANIIVATVFAIPLRFAPGLPTDDIHLILSYAVFANILLFSFNLIPIPPLDGFGLVSGIVSDSWYRLIAPLYRNGIVLLLIIGFGIPYITGILFHNNISIVSRIIGPVEALLQNLIIGYQIFG
jgi:Zn-dependent protease